MAYEVTARRWRPQEFESVIGQDHVTTTLKNAIQTGQVAHAYLFSGPRGVGKTTTARILAKALNCVHGPTVSPCNECSFCKEISEGRSVDVLEIDGASNNKVEQVRSHLVESVNYTPSQGKHKIYIIDEVHMLSTAAFNALLKTLEEPPEHVYFIFATTDPQKVLATILSRCQRFDFRRISSQTIVDHLSTISERSDYQIGNDALSIIARRADGSMRDAESLFDQAVAFGGTELTAVDVGTVLGLVAQDVYFDLMEKVASGDVAEGLRIIESVLRHGYNVNEIALGVIEHLRNLLIVKAVPETPGLLGAAVVDVSRYTDQAGHFSTEDLDRLIHLATSMETAVKSSALPKIQLEVGVVRMIRMEPSVLLKSVIDRLTEMASQLAGEDGANESSTESATDSTRTRTAQATVPQQVKETTDSIDHQTVDPIDTGTASEGVSRPRSETNSQPVPAVASDVEETPAATGGTPERLDLQVVTNAWPTVVDQIRQERPAMGSFIAAAVIQSCQDNRVTLAFSPQHDFHRQQADKNIHSIQEALGTVIGVQVNVQIISSEQATQGQTEPLLPSEPLPEVNSKTITGQDPSVKRVLDAFDGQVIDDNS